MNIFWLTSKTFFAEYAEIYIPCVRVFVRVDEDVTGWNVIVVRRPLLFAKDEGDA